MSNRILLAAAACAAALALVLASRVYLTAQQTEPAIIDSKTAGAADDKKPDKPPANAPTAAEISVEQKKVSDQFNELEASLLKMAEHTAATDPRRAALLRKAVEQSKEQTIDVFFKRVVDLLKDNRLGDALQDQAVIDQDLQALLDLLSSENRSKQIEAEKARYQEYLKNINRLIQDQKSLRGRTASAEALDRLAPEELKLANRTGGLSDQMDKNAQSGKNSAKTGKNAPDGKSPAGKAPSGKEGDRGDEQKSDENAKDPNQDKADSKDQKDAGQPKGERQGGPQGKTDNAGDRKGGAQPKGERQGGDQKQGEPQGGDQKQGDRQGGTQPKGERQGGDQKQGERQGGDQKQGERQGGNQPKGERQGGDQKQGERQGGDQKQGERQGGDQKQGERQGGTQPKGERQGGTQPKGERQGGDQKQGERQGGDQKQGERQGGTQPKGERQGGDQKKGERQGGDQKQGERQGGDQKQGERQGGDQKQGERQGGDQKQGERQGGNQPKGERQGGDQKKGERQGGDQKQGERQGGPQQKQQPKNQDGEQPQDQQPQDQQPQDQQPQDQQDQAQDEQPQDPIRDRLENARRRMEEAEQKLREAEREGALDMQEEALAELERAKAELERILRQLREEEKQRMLVRLEARFLKMQQMQREVHEGTVRLDKVPIEDRDQSHESEAERLANKEKLITVEADKPMLLLKEDGTAVVFPEALRQMRDDMQQIADRLGQARVDQITQVIESDVIAAIEEMLGAVRRAQREQGKDAANQDTKKKQNKKNQPGQKKQDDQQREAPPLVDTLAELRMIRAMQKQINDRTERYSKLIDGEQADKAEIIEALQRLADRELRVQKVTRDLELGRNPE
jgi:hypothetical protein